MGWSLTLLFILVAAGAGLQLISWLRLQAEGVLERLTYGAAVGLGAAAYLVLVIGLLGLLTPWAVGGLALLLLLVGGRKTVALVSDLSGALVGWAGRPRDLSGWLGFGLALYCLTLALLTLIAALAPPADLDWDSLTYHLAVPKLYLRHQKITFIDYDSHSNFPFTFQMLYTLGLAWSGAVGAKLFHWGAGWLTALVLAGWTDRHLRLAGGERPPWAAPLAAALWMSIPLVIWEAGTAYIDLGTALFQVAALAAVSRAMERRADGARGLDARWCLLAGIFTGWALGTKYTALVQFAALGLWLAAAALRRGRRAWTAVSLFGLASVVVGSPWYVKNVLWTNNPVYPFFYPLFPRSVHWNREFHVAYQNEQKSFGRRGPRDGFAEFLRAPWDLAFHGRHFFVTHQRLLRWDQWASLGLLPIAWLPLLFFARRLHPAAIALVAYFLFSFLVWWMLSKQSRYLMPAVAPLAPAAVLCLLALPGRGLRAAAAALVGVSLLGGALVGGQMASGPLVAVAGFRSERDYLRANLPGLYQAAEFVNRLPRGTRVAFYQDTRGFYFERDYLWANPGQNDLIPYEDLDSGGALADYLRKRLRVTHVLINLSLSGAVDRTRWWRLLQLGLDEGRFVPVFFWPDERTVADQRGMVVMEIR